MSHQVYADIFDRLWGENRFEEAIDAYFYVDRIFERSRWVALYFENQGQHEKAMEELEFYVQTCFQISDRFFPYPSGPIDLFLLGEWFERRKPWKAKQYLKLYLQADQFKETMGEGIDYKREAEEILKRIDVAWELKKQQEGKPMKQLLANLFKIEAEHKRKEDQAKKEAKAEVQIEEKQ
jgi:hypothetical protein